VAVSRSPLPVPSLVIVVFLVVGQPLALALTAAAALSRLALYGSPAYLLLLFRAFTAGLGLAAGRSLWARRADGRHLAAWWAVADACATTLTLATPFFPSNRLPGTKGPELAAWLLLDALVLLYVLRSRRLRAALREAPVPSLLGVDPPRD
jgi:hypothetical protein